MKKTFKDKYLFDFILISILLVTTPLFFFKLGQSSLVSFDEAWYADVARNVLKSGDLIHLRWNEKIYNDHPPVGFWITALSFKLSGITDLSARFMQATAGLLGLVFLYLLGKELFNRTVGFLSAISLSSSSWYLFRARSGNLDSFLVMFFILTLYLATKASKDERYLAPLSISMIFLFLTKTIVPFTIVPVIILIFWKSEVVKKTKFKFYLLLPFIIFLIWFRTQIAYDYDFAQHYFKIGLPGLEKTSSFIENLKLMKSYLHNGIGRWFWPSFFTLTISLITFQKRFLILFVFFVSFFLPFLLSREGHIWHLIPLHPVMILSFFGFSYFVFDRITKNKYLPTVIVFIFFLYLFIPQIERSWREFINIPANVSDVAILSKEAGNYPGKLYIDGDFEPEAVFYSGGTVGQIQRRAEQLKPLFARKESFTLITYQWRLDFEDISTESYEIIKKDRDKILVVNQ